MSLWVREEIQAVPRQAELIDGVCRTRVVAGILCNAGQQVLITDRSRASSMQSLWEFPGGKIESGESAAAALERELAEELGISNIRATHFRSLEHEYPDIHVAIDFYVVTGWSGTPTGIEGQALRWIGTNELDPALLLPADVPIIAALVAEGIPG